MNGYDLVISSSHCVAKGALAPAGADHVCYCHTPMRYAWDQEEAYFPQRDGPLARIRAVVLARLRRWDVSTADRPRRILANSRFVADRIRRYYGIATRRCSIRRWTWTTSLPAKARAGATRWWSSALAPYKRIELAVASLRRRRHRAARGGHRRAVPDRALGRRRSRPGSDASIASACASSTAAPWLFLQPGIEDFGIAAVEALACGTPVVAVGAGGVLDIVDDAGLGVLYSPGRRRRIRRSLTKSRKNALQYNEPANPGGVVLRNARFLARLDAILAAPMRPSGGKNRLIRQRHRNDGKHLPRQRSPRHARRVPRRVVSAFRISEVIPLTKTVPDVRALPRAAADRPPGAGRSSSTSTACTEPNRGRSRVDEVADRRCRRCCSPPCCCSGFSTWYRPPQRRAASSTSPTAAPSSASSRSPT